MVRRGSDPLAPSHVLTAASPCADKETRDKAVKTLTRYLKSGPVLEELDLAKIWKALFYCMWHADKPTVQNELAERLGAMVLAVPGNKATLFAKVGRPPLHHHLLHLHHLQQQQHLHLHPSIPTSTSTTTLTTTSTTTSTTTCARRSSL